MNSKKLLYLWALPFIAMLLLLAPAAASRYLLQNAPPPTANMNARPQDDPHGGNYNKRT
ncbi:conserved hypothetical protein [Ricinus communis]|uniref:Uncharacterized protein n=1 Tax=Ricinus communis TaxID=3988 RepID=B9R9U1_RICCO|nr:conserved hypothetical protein [Ricinus communis]